MSDKTLQQTVSDTSGKQDKIEWPKGDIRQTLHKLPKFDGELLVEVWVRPSKDGPEYCLFGMLTRFHKARGDWTYFVELGDEKESRTAKLRGARIYKLLVQNERRNDIHAAYAQTILEREDSKSGSTASRNRQLERLQMRKDQVISRVMDDSDRAFLANLRVGPLPAVGHSNVDPKWGEDVLRACMIAYLEGYNLVRPPPDATKIPKSVFVKVGLEFNKSASQIAKHYYRWLGAANPKD